MRIDELFNTSMDLEWTQRGRFKLASFEVGNLTYVVQIEDKPMPKVPELKGKRTAEVSFFVRNIENVDVAHSTQYQFGGEAAKVFGVVFQALAKQFVNYDAFYFAALPKHSSSNEELETKAGIYLTLANKMASSSVNTRVYDQKSQYGHAFLVSKIPLHDNDFINEAVEYMKQLGE